MDIKTIIWIIILICYILLLIVSLTVLVIVVKNYKKIGSDK